MSSDTIEAEARVIEDATDVSVLGEAGRWLAEKREYVAAKVADYGAYEVTDGDTYRQAKRERGQLRSAAKAINAERIEKVSGIRAALDRLNEETKGICAPLTDIADRLDAGCKAWEAREVEAKRAALREEYEDAMPLVALPAEGHDEALVPYARVEATFGEGRLGKRWGLYGTPLAECQRQLREAMGAVASAERGIDRMVAADDRDEVKALYFATLDLDAAMARAGELAEQRERILALEAERRRLEEERRAAEEAAEEAARAAEAAPEAVSEWDEGATEDGEPPADYLPAEAAGARVPCEPPRITAAPTVTEVPLAPPAPPAPPAPRPAPDAAGPWVVLVDSATSAQAREVGEALGALGVTGRFMRGTLSEVYARAAMRGEVC